MEIITGKKAAPWKIVLYGPPGVGKSSICAYAPNPLFIDIEFGLNRINCHKTPRISAWESGDMKAPGFIEAMKFAAESDYKTIVIDTISALESLLTDKVKKDFGKPIGSIAEMPYGTGFEALKAEWARVIKMVTRLQEGYGKNVVLVGHSKVEPVNDPTTESYDTFTLDTQKKSQQTITTNMDAVLFCRQEILTKERESGQKLRGITTGDRYIYTIETPAYLAKNRFGLEAKVKMSPEIFERLEK